MALKITGAMLLILSSFLIGYSFAKRLKIRRDFLKRIIVYLSNLSTNIRYNSSDIFSLSALSAKTAGITEFDFACLEDVSFTECWSKAVAGLPRTVPISTTDKELLLEFGAELGKTDVEGQLKHIELYKIIFEKQLAQAEEAVRQKSKLYKTVGLFAGTATALMIM